MQAKRKMKNESDLLYGCLKTLVANNYRVYRQNNGAFETREGRWIKCCNEHDGSSVSGISDIIGWTPEGIYLAVECKWMDGVVSKEQTDFIKSVLAGGGIGVVVRSIAELRERVMTRVTTAKVENKWEKFHLYMKAKRLVLEGWNVPTGIIEIVGPVPNAEMDQWCQEMALGIEQKGCPN